MFVYLIRFLCHICSSPCFSPLLPTHSAPHRCTLLSLSLLQGCSPNRVTRIFRRHRASREVKRKTEPLPNALCRTHCVRAVRLCVRHTLGTWDSVCGTHSVRETLCAAHTRYVRLCVRHTLGTWHSVCGTHYAVETQWVRCLQTLYRTP